MEVSQIANRNAIPVILPIMKAWCLCRARVELDKGVQSGAIVENAEPPIGETVQQDLQSAFKVKHGYNPLTTRMAGDNLFGKLYRELHNSPRKFSILFPDNVNVVGGALRGRRASPSDVSPVAPLLLPQNPQTMSCPTTTCTIASVPSSAVSI